MTDIELRKQLWEAYYKDGNKEKYGDDGEMQSGLIDFKRFSIETIYKMIVNTDRRKVLDKVLARVIEEDCCSCSNLDVFKDIIKKEEEK
jgi:hypothetical protein